MPRLFSKPRTADTLDRVGARVPCVLTTQVRSRLVRVASEAAEVVAAVAVAVVAAALAAAVVAVAVSAAAVVAAEVVVEAAAVALAAQAEEALEGSRERRSLSK